MVELKEEGKNVPCLSYRDSTLREKDFSPSSSLVIFSLAYLGKKMKGLPT